jgi:hypothetical protein
VRIVAIWSQTPHMALMVRFGTFERRKTAACLVRQRSGEFSVPPAVVVTFGKRRRGGRKTPQEIPQSYGG